MQNYPESAFQNNVIAADFAGCDRLFPQTVPVHDASVFCAVEGVNEGDSLSVLDDLVPDDVYVLAAGSTTSSLAFHMTSGHVPEIAASSETGTAGASLHLDGTVTLMSAAGRIARAIILVETDMHDHIAAIYLASLDPIAPGTPFSIIALDRLSTRAAFDELIGHTAVNPVMKPAKNAAPSAGIRA